MPDNDNKKPVPAIRYQELGTSGLYRTGGFVLDDLLPQLRGRQAQIAWRDMSDNDPIVGAILVAIERILLQVDWKVLPYDDPDQREEPTDDDILAAAFVKSCMDDMEHSWHELLVAIATYLPYGWAFFEVVFKQRKGPDQKDPKFRSKYKDNKIGWRKIALRVQDSLWMWEFDDNGGVVAMVQRDPTTGRSITIPIAKGLLFRTTSARGNPEGRAVLRNAFRPWYFKRKLEEIEAVGVERDLCGVPVVGVPESWMSPDATPDEKMSLAAAERTARGLKNHQNAGIVKPLMYDDDGHPLFTVELMGSPGAKQFDTGKIIDRYNTQIAMTLLADFIMLGHENVGSFALGAGKIDLFVAAVESWVRQIAEVFNTHAIPNLMKLNGGDMSRLPRLAYGQVSAVDLQELGTTLLNLKNAGLITPDNGTEEWLRELINMPPYTADDGEQSKNVRYGYEVDNPETHIAAMASGMMDANKNPIPQADPSQPPNPDGGQPTVPTGAPPDNKQAVPAKTAPEPATPAGKPSPLKTQEEKTPAKTVEDV